ncbi:MAG: VOC family protein [Chloroflexi bacterium]|nr:VOC family protein [Chloroflexota bacterium]
MLKGFAYHGLTVSDLDRSIAFYRDLIHMKVEETYEAVGEDIEEATGLPGAQARVAMLTWNNRRLKLMQFLSPRGKQRFEARICDVGASHGSIRVDNVQEVYDDLRARGVRFMSAPVTPRPERPERKFTYMLDPDGIVWEVHRGEPHHSHIVADVGKGIALYKDTLGMKVDVALDITGTGIEIGSGLPGAHLRSIHMVLDTDEFLELHHYVYPGGKRLPQNRLCDVGCSHVAFEVEDVQRAYEALRARGVRFVAQPVHLTTEKAGVQSVYMLDPEDYVLELRSGA